MFSITDCKRDDKVYDNGEKIVDPENPCRVCVCRGQYFSYFLYFYLYTIDIKLHKIVDTFRI